MAGRDAQAITLMMKMNTLSSTSLLKDAAAVTLAGGDLEAIFLPTYGMLAASLRHRGEEILGRVEDLENAARKGSTAGIPFLHPWANRLAGYKYRVAERDVTLDPFSPLLHFDENGLPIHGVPWPLLRWDVIEASVACLRCLDVGNNAYCKWRRSCPGELRIPPLSEVAGAFTRGLAAASTADAEDGARWEGHSNRRG